MLHVIVPVYNEGRSIYDLLKAFAGVFGKHELAHVVHVVDDGSSDDSAHHIRQAVQDYPDLTVDFIQHEQNAGLAATLRTGFETLRDQLADDDSVVTMDGDNTHDPHLIPAMIAAGGDIVIASRYQKGARIKGLSWSRIMMSWGAGRLYRLAWNIPGVRDYTCGFRLFRGSVVRGFLGAYSDRLIEEAGFAVTAEILAKTSKFSSRVVEVPMVLDYSRKVAESHNPILSTIMMTIAILFKKY